MPKRFFLPNDYPDFSSQGTPPCAEAMPDSYFSDTSSKNGYTHGANAKKICSTCPYQIVCLEYALKHNEIGIWGGTTENERRRMKGTVLGHGRPRRIQ
jgi:hypothetical protein